MEENKAILEEEISCKLLVTFLKVSLEREKEGGERNKGKSDKEASSTSENHCVEDPSSMLQHRFPRKHWEQAIVYFS